MHFGELKFAVAVGVHRGPDTVRRDELDAHTFGRVSALDPNDSCGAAIESALNGPFIGLCAIPRVRRRILALDAAFSRSDIGPQIGDIRFGQSMAISRHARTTRFDLRGYTLVRYGLAGYQLRALIEILQRRAALGVFVVTHPAFIEVNHFATSGTAIGNDSVGIQPEGLLKIVCHSDGIGNSLLGRANSRMEPRRRACEKQSYSHGEHHTHHA